MSASQHTREMPASDRSSTVKPTCDLVVVGAGVFGLTATLELDARGHEVAVLDPGPLPHPLAASTDISKVFRVDYGPDQEYTALAERAREGWLRWNTELSEPLYHEVGVSMLTRSPMSPGGFEYESYQLLRERGYSLERLSSAEIARRFPAWNAERYVDGYFHATGGYVESGRVIEALVDKARTAGIALHTGQMVEELMEQDGAVTGVRTREGETFSAGHVVVAAGAWTPLLVPELTSVMHPVGLPVFHLKPADPSLFEPPNFVVFGADVDETGWYGFPVHPREGVVKIAYHGAGRPVHPSKDDRVVTEAETQRLQTFVAETFPALAEAPVVYTRYCLYCDTLDEHFWIARHPERGGMTVAAGGSGHAFKFAPVLGELTADAVEGKRNPHLQKFRWRSLTPETTGEEATRHRG